MKKLSIILFSILEILLLTPSVNATTAYTLEPSYYKITIAPGETYNAHTVNQRLKLPDKLDANSTNYRTKCLSMKEEWCTCYSYTVAYVYTPWAASKDTPKFENSDVAKIEPSYIAGRCTEIPDKSEFRITGLKSGEAILYIRTFSIMSFYKENPDGSSNKSSEKVNWLAHPDSVSWQDYVGQSTISTAGVTGQSSSVANWIIVDPAYQKQNTSNKTNQTPTSSPSQSPTSNTSPDTSTTYPFNPTDNQDYYNFDSSNSTNTNDDAIPTVESPTEPDTNTKPEPLIFILISITILLGMALLSTLGYIIYHQHKITKPNQRKKKNGQN